MIKTKRLYKDDVYLRSCQSTVLEVETSEGSTFVVLDKTVFFATGGGQSCDVGKIENYCVTDVFEAEGKIVHRIDEPCNLGAGDVVSCEIDWQRRFDNMQRHCGEHILSGIFHKLFGGVNRGFHMGDDYMTIDISLEEKPEFTKLTYQMAMEAERETNKVIWGNLPVISKHFDTREEALSMPLRKELKLEEDITIVSIGSTQNPSDCVNCCGTHPAFTGQVGLLKIYKVEKNKSMFRVYFDAGQRAYEKCNKLYDDVYHFSKGHSCQVEDFSKAIGKIEEKQAQLKDDKNLLEKEVIALLTEKLLEKTADENIVFERYDFLSSKQLLNLGKSIDLEDSKNLLLCNDREKVCFLFSRGVDCRKFIETLLEMNTFEIKGGTKDQGFLRFSYKGDYEKMKEAVVSALGIECKYCFSKRNYDII